MRKSVLFAAICGLLGCASGVFAQDANHTVSGVTVIGHANDTPARQVERIGQVDGGGGLARWDMPVCPSTTGLPTGYNDFITQRIGKVAEQVGAPIALKACQPNVLIFVTPDPDAFTQRIVKLKAQALAGGRWPVDKIKLAAFAKDPDPVRWLYLSTAVQASPGGAPVTDPASPSHAAGVANGGAGACACGLEAFLGAGAGPTAPQLGNVIPSRLMPASEQTFTQAVIVVDAKRIAGLEAGQIADYLAMVTLAHVKVRSTFGGSDTILNLFADAGSDASRPAGLRPWDVAYLEGLYKSDAQRTYGSQVSHIADRMAAEFKQSDAAAK